MHEPRFPSQAEIIRAWLELQSEPRTCPEIAAAIGRPGDTKVYQNVHRMFRDGILVREGQCRSYRFSPGRPPTVRTRMPHEEYLRRAREANRKAHSKRRGRTLAEYNAERAEQRRATAARREAEKAARRAAREAERAQREADRAAANAAKPPKKCKPKPKAAQKPRVRRVRPQVVPAAATAPRVDGVESIADFLRRGGQIVRLEPFAVSRPLRINQQRKAA